MLMIPKFYSYICTEVERKMTSQFDNAPQMLGHLMKSFKRLQGLALKPYDLGALYAPFINVLYHHQDGISLKELGELIGVDKAHISRVIVALEGMGYVERFKVGEPPSRSRVRLTESGLALARDYSREMADIKQQLLSSVSDEELAALLKTLQKLAQKAEEIERE